MNSKSKTKREMFEIFIDLITHCIYMYVRVYVADNSNKLLLMHACLKYLRTYIRMYQGITETMCILQVYIL